MISRLALDETSRNGTVVPTHQRRLSLKRSVEFRFGAISGYEHAKPEFGVPFHLRSRRTSPLSHDEMMHPVRSRL